MASHDIDYELIGDDMQIVEVELDPGETVIAEAGAMNYMEEGIDFEARMGDGSETESGLMGKLLGAGKRVLTGESIFMTHFTHQGSGKARVSFAAPYPGKIIPVDLDSAGGELICQKDAFLCAAKGTKVSIAFNRKLGAGFFGGEGFILQKLQGDVILNRDVRNDGAVSISHRQFRSHVGVVGHDDLYVISVRRRCYLHRGIGGLLQFAGFRHDNLRLVNDCGHVARLGYHRRVGHVGDAWRSRCGLLRRLHGGRHCSGFEDGAIGWRDAFPTAMD